MSQSSNLIRAAHHLAVPMLDVTTVFALVYLNILAIHTSAVDRNVYLARIVRPTERVYETNV